MSLHHTGCMLQILALVPILNFPRITHHQSRVDCGEEVGETCRLGEGAVFCLLFLCLFRLCASYLLRILCLEALLCKLLQCTQSFSSSFAFETFTNKGFTRQSFRSLWDFLFLYSLSLAAMSGTLSYLVHCSGGRGNSGP